MKIVSPLFFLLIFFINTAVAQNIRLRGTVKDSLSTLSGATVSLFGDQKNPVAETLTDSTGRFYFLLKEKREYRVEIRHAGYHLHQQVIIVNADIDAGIITLRSNNSTMQEVVVRAKQPVIEIGSDPNTL
ncbi:MAG TPA: carboxypeptidase-like regulatory domain-containing protein, partial [Chitinophagaceae bacterium]|nr:carboxypeptidase-like regulatory domain-containing protein [Chitinophagaceae bacterium]